MSTKCKTDFVTYKSALWCWTIYEYLTTVPLCITYYQLYMYVIGRDDMNIFNSIKCLDNLTWLMSLSLSHPPPLRYLLMWHRLLKTPVFFFFYLRMTAHIYSHPTSRQTNMEACNNRAHQIPTYACLWMLFSLLQVGFSMGNCDWEYENWLYIDRFRRWC